jgi:AmmeMemoRadiSam system protein A
MLPDESRQLLVELARISVAARVKGGSATVAPASAFPPASGVFVTVKVSGQLRGCLGTLECRDLASDVTRCAAEAASEDPRFPPIEVTELPALTVEVSVLGPLERIDPHDPNAIVIGRDGLVVEQGHRRGLLLPQVASERGWSREKFLDQTCVKAGLHADAWRRGATVYRFSAEVLSEE